MIDFTKLTKPTVKIQLGEQVLECNMPSEEILRAMIGFNQLQDDKAIDGLYTCLTEIFNSNIDGDVYSYDDIKKHINVGLCKDIFKQYFNGVQENLLK